MEEALSVDAAARPKVHLVCYLGASSGPALARHFLNHYYRLGVDRFLIVLHDSSSDPQTLAVAAELAACSVTPVLRVDDYSTLLARRRRQAVVNEHCRPDDWVLYTDADELQVYPNELYAVVRGLEQAGASYATGRFVDRVAPVGDLPEIRAEPAVWEQFPRASALTERVTGGCTRKVCLARAHLKLADGGCHAIAFGPNWTLNYERTHSGRSLQPLVEIHHFKWDATLRQRLDKKLSGHGGDRDRVDGAGFMDEYRRLARHLKDGQSLALPDSRWLGTPELHYQRAPLVPVNVAPALVAELLANVPSPRAELAPAAGAPSAGAPVPQTLSGFAVRRRWGSGKGLQ